MNGLKSKVKTKAAIAVVTAGLLGIGGSTLGGAAFTPVSHNANHPQPPGCKKVKQPKYGKKPKKRCSNQNQTSSN